MFGAARYVGRFAPLLLSLRSAAGARLGPPGARARQSHRGRRMPTLFAQFYAAAHTDLLVWGSLSCCCSILLLVTYYILPDVRRTPGWQFLYSSLYDLYASAGFVAIALLGSPMSSDAAIHLLLPPGLLPAGVAEDDPDVVEHAICAAYLPLFVSFLAADMGASCWRLLMYVDLIVVYHNPFRTTPGRPLYHIAVLLAAALWALALSDTSVLCTSSDGSGSLNLQTLTVSLVYAPFCLFVFGGGTLYSVVAWLLSHDKAPAQPPRIRPYGRRWAVSDPLLAPLPRRRASRSNPTPNPDPRRAARSRCSRGSE